MIIPTLFVIVCARFAVSLNLGESCSLKNGDAGLCKQVYDCKSVFGEAIAGNLPDTICGYEGDNPLVCCPKYSPSGSVGGWRRWKPECDVARELARKKCALYSRYVYTANSPSLNDSEPTFNDSQCGIKSKILDFGRAKVESMEFPHMVAYGYKREGVNMTWFCSGTLISERHVLTTAHCTRVYRVPDFGYVRVGSSRLLDTPNGEDGAMIRRVIVRSRYPQYRYPAQYHDIAVLTLESELRLNGWIRPACLYTGSSTSLTEAVETAWNRLDWFERDNSENMLKIIMSISDDQTCEKRWNFTSSYLPDGIDVALSMCAVVKDEQSCMGESGAPLVTFSDEKYHCMYDVVGVASLGEVCRSNYPGVYTRVSRYLPWIVSVVWPLGI